MNEANETPNTNYHDAIRSLEHTLDRLHGCTDAEREKLHAEFLHLKEMSEKLVKGRIDIVVFGEISTGKSACINAIVGKEITQVDVQGGWTKEIWNVPWDGSGYCIPGLGESGVVLIDTPGLNEVGGTERASMAREAAAKADLILFVTDSDLNETEHSALLELASLHKPLLLVLNKIDLYSPAQRARLQEVLKERLQGVLAKEGVILAAANPKEKEYIIERTDGSSINEWRKPPAEIDELKKAILVLLDREGLSLIALNAALYAADKTDQIAVLRVELREQKAQNFIWSYATLKSVAVALNPAPVADVLGGSVVDVFMVLNLARVYGLEMTWSNANNLVKSILKSAGWVLASEMATHLGSSLLKFFTVGYSTVFSAIPQGAAAGYGSYIVGQAAKKYLEQGASWGEESPKKVVQQILEETDKKSVLNRLKEELRQKLLKNQHVK
ncbi:MAG: GTP-binding protein [Pirellulaceae bacterium]|nr:GTP-binding protein [Pirellulaceae bacterium]